MAYKDMDLESLQKERNQFAFWSAHARKKAEKQDPFWQKDAVWLETDTPLNKSRGFFLQPSNLPLSLEGEQ